MPTRPHILFVEDDDVLREHITRVLSDEFNVEAAHDGEQALSAILRSLPDLVVTDVVMPGLDGVELVKTLRSTQRTRTIPVLLTSGRAPDELRIEGFERGADGYLAKPYTERELRAQIRAMVKSSRVRREAAAHEAQEEAERRSVAERAALLESITDPFFALDHDWRFIYVNQKALDYYGTRREIVIGNTLWAAFPVLEGSVFEQQFKAAVREQRSITFEALSQVTKRWLEVHAYPSAQGLAVHVRDIGDRKRAEAEREAALHQLRGREQRLELASELAGLGIFVWDIRADRITSENIRSYDIFGRTPDDPKLSSEDFRARFVHPEDVHSFDRQLQATLREGVPLHATCRIRRQNDGAWRWVEIVGRMEADANGVPARLLGVLRDVTEERSGREAMRDREERFRRLAETVPALVFVANAEGANIYTNARFQEFVGRPADALIGDGWLDVLHPDDRERAAQIWNHAVAHAARYGTEYRFRRYDGAYRWFLVRGSPARDASGAVSAWYGTCTDVDEARRTEEALREEKDTLETLNHLGRAIAAELDLERTAQAITDAATKLSGAAFGAFLYNTRDENEDAYALYALSGAAHEAFANFSMPRNAAMFGPTLRGEPTVRSDDITIDPRYSDSAPDRDAPGDSLGVRSYLASPVVSRSGEVLGGLFFGHPDVGVFTPRAERLISGVAAQAAIAIDNAHLYKALREADRRKDEFLAVLAHELRNPLAPIRNGLHIVRLRASTDGTVQGVLNMMDRQMTHVVRLVDDLLDISRITRGKLELKREPVLLTDVLGNAIDATRVFIEAHGHQLLIDLQTDGVTVQGDPERLTQVFANLLSNSAKYTERGGRIIVRLRREAGEAVGEVQDNGAGIAPQDLERVFDLFAQVGSPATGGLGIGLSLVKTIVEMHSGRIHAFSAGIGAGSTFTVRLPLLESDAVASSPGAPAASMHPQNRAGRRILVADDNVDAANSLALLLEQDGHEIRTAEDGLAAVEKTIDFSPEIVFMDIGMPRLDGLEATRRIRSLPNGNDIFIVAVTGWGQPADVQRTREAGMDHHLVKPVSMQALDETLAYVQRKRANSSI